MNFPKIFSVSERPFKFVDSLIYLLSLLVAMDIFTTFYGIVFRDINDMNTLVHINLPYFIIHNLFYLIVMICLTLFLTQNNKDNEPLVFWGVVSWILLFIGQKIIVVFSNIAVLYSIL